MLETRSFGNTCFSKDANSNAPSTFSAHNSAFTSDNAVITGIAAAVSVFFLLSIISIICFGIMICNNIIISAIMIIMSVIMYYVIIMCKQNKFKYSCKTA